MRAAGIVHIASSMLNSLHSGSDELGRANKSKRQHFEPEPGLKAALARSIFLRIGEAPVASAIWADKQMGPAAVGELIRLLLPFGVPSRGIGEWHVGISVTAGD
jgi:hypothetical protein